MHILTQIPGTAPLATGHPHGLPDPRRTEAPLSRVQPIALARDPEAALTRGQTPANFWRATSGEPDPEQIAPPSIMQIRISRLLDQQRETGIVPAPESAAAEAADYGNARSSAFSTLP